MTVEQVFVGTAVLLLVTPIGPDAACEQDEDQCGSRPLGSGLQSTVSYLHRFTHASPALVDPIANVEPCQRSGDDADPSSIATESEGQIGLLTVTCANSHSTRMR